MSNPYVASAEGPTATSGLGVVDDIVSLSNDLASGDWLAAGMDALATGLDAAATVSDPLGSAIAAGIGFILDHLDPLKHWLDELAGNPEQVSANAQTYKNVAQGLANDASTLSSSIDKDLGEQSGQTIEAYRDQAGHVVEALNALAQGAGASGDAMEVAATVVQAVHDAVRDAIAEIVGAVISYAAELIFTLGLATPLVIEQATTRVADVSARIGKDVTGAVTSAKNLSDLVSKLDGLVKSIGPEMDKLLKGGGKPGVPGGTGTRGLPGKDGPGHAPGEDTPDAKGTADDPDKTSKDGVPDDAKSGCGDPVDMATGAVYLQETDLHLPGDLPLRISRRHASDWTYGQWFGASWSSSFDERVDVHVSAVGERSLVVVRDDGTVQVFPMPQPGSTSRPKAGGRSVLGITPVGYRVLDTDTGVSRHYEAGPSGRAWLGAITDVAGHRVSFLRDEKGAPVEVAHSGGYRVRVSTYEGRVTGLTVVDANGLDPVEVIRYGYDALGDLVAVVNESGQAMRFVYSEHRLVRWEDRNGTVYSYRYDALGRCVSQGGSDGTMQNTFAYAPVGPDGLRQTSVTDARGNTTRFLINERHQVVATIDPLGGEVRTEWDAQNRPLTRSDQLGRTVRYTYDADGNLSVFTRPDGTTQKVAWTQTPGGPRPARVTLPDGGAWSHTYDEAGRTIATTDPAGATTGFAYDDRGHLAAVTDPMGRVRHVETDAYGLATRVVEANGAVMEIARDHLGRAVATVDAVGARTEYTWTPSGRLASRRLPDGTEESWTYDGEGNPLTYVDAAGRVVETRFTHFDLPAEVTRPDGSTTRYAYDSDLRLVSVTNAQDATWTYVYDEAGRLASETDYNGRTVTYARDAAGQLILKTNGAGETISYSYDAVGNMLTQQVDSATGPVLTTMEYDANGQMTSATSPGVELGIAYDPVGRVVAETVNGRAVTTAYDPLGRTSRQLTPGGVETLWTYGLGLAPERVSIGGHEIDVERDLAGRETRRTTGEVVLEQTWNLLGQPLTQTVQKRATRPAPVSLEDRLSGAAPTRPVVAAAAELLQERTFAYEAGGRLVGVSDQLSGARRFELDLNDRITAVSLDGETSETYGYDALGGITSATGGSDPDPVSDPTRARDGRSHDGTLLITSGRSRYAYDAQGRLTRHTRARLSRKPETWLYEWDASDRLTALRTPDGVRWTYLYDVFGRRVAKRRHAPSGDVAEETVFAWAGPLLVEQTVAAGTSSAPRTTSWAYHGFEPLAQLGDTTGAAGGDAGTIDADQDAIDAEFYAIVTDLAGAPAELLTSAGELVWHARHTIWGAPTDDRAALTPLRFPGQYADAESGLHYNLNRYYDPRTGRYLSQDPLGLAPAPNPNTYVTNPVRLADPTGLAPTKCGLEKGPDGQYYSPQGLIYGPDPNVRFDSRVDHVNYHDKDDPARPGKHSYFDAGHAAIQTTDEAWAKAQAAAAGDPGVRSITNARGRTTTWVDMGRTVGNEGGQAGSGAPLNWVKIITEGDNVITSFPVASGTS